MENASNAILMAAGILIGVIILTIMVYLFSSFGGTSAQIQAQIDAKNMAEFNNHFLQYEDKTTCTIHDIVSLVNFTKKYNSDFPEIDSPYHISVSLREYRNGMDLTDETKITEEHLTNLLKNWSNQEDGKIQTYTCTKITYMGQENGNRVKSISFEKTKKQEV